MASKIAADPRIDPRIRAVFADIPDRSTPTNVANRDELMAEEASEAGKIAAAGHKAWTVAMTDTSAAPAEGLIVRTERIQSQPDGNWINLQIIRPDTDEQLACLYNIHGGGMATMSCFDDIHRTWGRIIASQGVCVVMVDFRNALRPSSAPEVAPYPAGLNDCASGLRWVCANTKALNIDPARIVISGESGGGNLTLALGLKLKREGDIGLVKGLYALCPSVAGEWPQDQYPSSVENNGLLLNLHSNRSAMTYGIEALEARDPLAWPGFATVEDVRGLPPTVISVNECDPLRDEGIAFYRLLLKAGVPARGRVVLGTIHGTEIFTVCCPDISYDTASDMANFARR